MEQCCYIPLDDTDASMSSMDTKNTPQERSIKSTISDCVVIFIIYSISMILEWGSIHPHKQVIPGFTHNHNNINNNINDNINYTFAYPMNDSTVPTPVLLTLGGLIWIIPMLIHGLILWKYDSTFNWKIYLKFVYLITRIVSFAFAVTSVITDIIKKFVGSPRPYFLTAAYEFKNGDITSREMDNATQSFVSGHASEAWCLFFLLSIYFYKSYSYSMKCYFVNKNIAKYSCHNPHSYFMANLWYKLAEMPLISIGIIFIPTYFALYVSLTRIIDYKHTPTDITAGALLGALTSYLTYLIYYNEMYLIFEFNQLSKNEIKQKDSNLTTNTSFQIQMQKQSQDTTSNNTNV